MTMTTNEVALTVGAMVAGIALGGGFFGGLFWTIRRGLGARLPALWFLLSLLVRTSVAILVFYWVGGNRWERLLACGFGFLVARIVAGRLVRRASLDIAQSPCGARHAP